MRSGPKRFNYDAASRRWRNSRDSADMLEMLTSELRQLLGVSVDLERKPGSAAGPD